MLTSLGRNDLCPCGSGRKAKKCHERVVGMRHDAAQWFLDHLMFLEGYAGYVSPMSAQEHAAWRETGCPYRSCQWETDAGKSCGAGCGV